MTSTCFVCRPIQHILQPLDVGVFKSFKSYFSKFCTTFLANNHGQVITPDMLASLVAEAWPHSHTSLNIMSGFKKCGIFPFNPSAVEDRQTDPSKAFRQDKPLPDNEQPSDPGSPLFTSEQETLYARRFEEEYDLKDPAYVAWLKINHPDVPVSITGSDDKSTSHSSSPTACSSDVLSEVLSLPRPKSPKRKRRAAVNSKAVCITDTEILEEMKIKEAKKLEAEQEMGMRKLEREKKRQERELINAQKEERKKQKAREKEEKERDKVQRRIEKEQKRREKKTATSRRKPKTTVDALDVDEVTSLFPDMDVNDGSESEDTVTVCPKCGMIYGDDSNVLWFCCDGCDAWLNIQCTDVSRNNIPESYYCEQCM